MKKVSLKDIAKIAGVSPTTASFVLNGKAEQMRISEALAEKIKAIADKAGYYPNQVAVSLRTGHSNTLGLMVESIAGNFFASLSKIIEEEAKKFGYTVMYCSTENEADKGKELIRTLSQQQVDGYIITPAPGMKKFITDLYAQQHKPIVLLDSFYPDEDIPYVSVDNYAGIKQGMEHLLQKGYKNIGFITADLDLVQMKQRLNAYNDCLKAHDIKRHKDLILQIPYDLSKEKIIGEITDFIKKHSALDALFFATNYLGIAGLESIIQSGIKIPEDLAVICFDDHDILRLYPPGITIIQQPVEEIARAASQLLMTQLGKKSSKQSKTQIQLPPKLVKRGSTR